MKISHNWLQTYFAKKIPSADKLDELFNMHAFEVEGVEKVGGGFLKKGDMVLDIKVLPDRAHYALCHRGIAKEIQAITDLKITPHQFKLAEVTASVPIPKVEIKNKDLCNRYVARRIENISVGDSPEFLKTSLQTVGQRSINTIVDATNFVMLDIGQPLHAFDADKVKGEIHVRLATAGEKITLLDGREVELRITDLVIADEIGPIAIAGVKGGKRAEVSKDTKNIILESANFNPTSVRRTATFFNLRNDSSKRFENEITPDLCSEAMDHVTALITKLSPKVKVGETVDIYPKSAKSWSVHISPESISSIIGVSLSAKEIEAILIKMNCKVEEKSGELVVTPPLDRLDMQIPQDIADEVGRISGYEKLATVLPPNLKETVSVDKTFYYAEKVKNILVKHGFSETLLYTLVPKGHFEITYPLASDKAALRESLIPKIQDALIMNARNTDLLELSAIQIFEIGQIFLGAGEKTSLCIGCASNNKKIQPEIIVGSIIKEIEKALGITIPEPVPQYMVSTTLDNKVKVYIRELNFNKLIEALPAPKDLHDVHFDILPKDKKYVPFSPYPFASRDIAVFVPKEIKENEVSGAIKKHAGAYLLKMKLFDVFSKEDKTSYAFRLIFQSQEKTLEEKEINNAMTAVNSVIVSKSWTVR